MGILSIQSRVVYGHVGNSAAVFLLQRLGFDVWPVDTVSFSNHPGYPTIRGRRVPAAEVRVLLGGLEERGAFARCEAVLSGYLGEEATADVVRDAVARVKAARPDALYCCDPVMGDAGKPLYVAPGLPARFRDLLVPAADLVTPNPVELGHLTGQPVATLAEARAAAEAVRGRGPSVVVVTGIPEAGGRVLATLAVGPGGAWVARTAARDRPSHGAGDAFTALFLGAYVGRRDLPEALARAVGAMEAIFDASAAGDSRDLALVAAGDRVAAGPRAAVERLG
jgi:pyridoxine kinase